jgi:hypothetical protein
MTATTAIWLSLVAILVSVTGTAANMYYARKMRRRLMGERERIRQNEP